MKDEKISIIFPPRKMFLNPDKVFQDFGKPNRDYRNLRAEMPDEGGIFTVIPGRPWAYPGFPFPTIVNNVAIFKRILISRIRSFTKNPLMWLTYWQFKRELKEIGAVFLDKYYLKPERYCRMAREIYRVLSKFFPLDLVHNICMILEYDSAYRIRVQYAALLLSKIKGIWNTLRMCEQHEHDPNMKSKWRAIRYLVAFLWINPFTHFKLKKIFDEIKVEEFFPTQADEYYLIKLAMENVNWYKEYYGTAET